MVEQSRRLEWNFEVNFGRFLVGLFLIVTGVTGDPIFLLVAGIAILFGPTIVVTKPDVTTNIRVQKLWWIGIAHQRKWTLEYLNQVLKQEGLESPVSEEEWGT